MNGQHRVGPHRAIATVLSMLLVAGVLALAACGGSGKAASTAPPAPTPSAAVSSPGTAAGGASPVATPTTPAQVAAAYVAAGLAAGTSTVELFAKDSRYEDRAAGDIRVGTKAIGRYMDFLAGFLTIEPRSQLVGSDAVVVEEVAGGELYGAEVLRVRGGKVLTCFVYYNDAQPSFAGEPALLKTPPASTDTQAASRTLANTYMAALHALSPGSLAALYAHDVVYQDTGRDLRYVGPSAAAAAHARMFSLRGVRFRANGVLAGPGWAAVMWRRTDREGGKPLVDLPARWLKWGKRPTIHGLSILEIRDSEIVRETIYSDHLRTKY
jgi:SnoaL-like domain